MNKPDLRINDLIRTSPQEKRVILWRLKEINHDVLTTVFSQPGLTFKQKYRLLQSSIFWAEAKNLLLQYFNGEKCSMCNEHIDFNCVLHHKNYCKEEIFTPGFVEFVHPKCHKKIHEK